MVKFMRLDDRLIHGQVAIRWSKFLDIKMILVANDLISQDPNQVRLLKMAAPPGIKCSVLTVDDAIKNVNDPRAKDMVIMIIVNNFRDILRIAQGATDQIERINFGNQTIMDTTGLRKITQFVYVTDDDLACIEELQKLGLNIDCQIRPEMAFVTLESALKSLS